MEYLGQIGGPGGYVAAIKAAQEGLKVSGTLACGSSEYGVNECVDCLYRKEGRPWRHLLERGMYPIKISTKQLPYLPPGQDRY